MIIIMNHVAIANKHRQPFTHVEPWPFDGVIVKSSSTGFLLSSLFIVVSLREPICGFCYPVIPLPTRCVRTRDSAVSSHFLGPYAWGSTEKHQPTDAFPCRCASPFPPHILVARFSHCCVCLSSVFFALGSICTPQQLILWNMQGSITPNHYKQTDDNGTVRTLLMLTTWHQWQTTDFSDALLLRP